MDAKGVNSIVLSMYVNPKERDQVLRSLTRSLEAARADEGRMDEPPMAVVSGVPLYRSDFDGDEDVRKVLLARDAVLSKTRNAGAALRAELSQ